jgi:hypothetical protein
MNDLPSTILVLVPRHRGFDWFKADCWPARRSTAKLADEPVLSKGGFAPITVISSLLETPESGHRSFSPAQSLELLVL